MFCSMYFIMLPRHLLKLFLFHVFHSVVSSILRTWTLMKRALCAGAPRQSSRPKWPWRAFGSPSSMMVSKIFYGTIHKLCGTLPCNLSQSMGCLGRAGFRLGARIEANGKSTPESRRRLAMATTRLTKMISIWKGQCKKKKN